MLNQNLKHLYGIRYNQPLFGPHSVRISATFSAIYPHSLAAPFFNLLKVIIHMPNPLYLSGALKMIYHHITSFKLYLAFSSLTSPPQLNSAIPVKRYLKPTNIRVVITSVNSWVAWTFAKRN